MLIDFSISGYTSFKDKATISMEKSKIQQHPEHIISDNLLSGAVIYGANASGKTNILQALKILANIVNAPWLGNVNPIPLLLQNFFNKDSSTTPLFEVHFLKNDVKYSYALSVSAGQIQTERFCFYRGNKEELLFERNQLNVTYGKTLSASWYNKDKTAQPFVPWLSSLEAYYGVSSNKIEGHEHFDAALDFFRDIEYINEKSITIGERFYQAFQTDDFKTFLVKLLKNADVGIEDIMFEDVPTPIIPVNSPVVTLPPNGHIAQVTTDRLFVFSNENGQIKCKQLMIKHYGCDKLFELAYESAGTLKLIHLSLSLFMQKQNEKVLLLDELDSLLHPLITKSLLTMLLNDNGKGQIITALHNTYLLSHDIWRVDEIWFTTKNSNGESRIYPLTDINPRFDKNLEKDYINGRYGAIPFPGGEKQWQEIFPE